MSPARKNEDGASAVEYGLLLSGIAAVIVAVVYALGTTTMGLFDTSCDGLKDAVSQSQGGPPASC